MCLGFKEKALINEIHPEIFTDEIIYFKILRIKIIEELEKINQDVYMVLMRLFFLRVIENLIIKKLL